MFQIFYGAYDESNPQSADPNIRSGSIEVYQFLDGAARNTNILRDIGGALQDNALFGSSWVTNKVSQALWGTNLINTDSAEYDNTDTVYAVVTLPLPTPGGKYKAANALLKHRKAIKAIVMNASRSGVALSPSKVDQLRRVVTRAGGRLRTEVGKTGTVKGILHSQVEGFGKKTAARHIIHLVQ